MNYTHRTSAPRSLVVTFLVTFAFLMAPALLSSMSAQTRPLPQTLPIKNKRDSSGTGTSTTTPAPGAPVITTQPANVTVIAGKPVSLSIVATGNPAPAYRWQLSADGNLWADVTNNDTNSGATAAKLTIITSSGVGTNLSAKKYRCLASNHVGMATSNVVTVTVKPTDSAPLINVQPKDISVMAGQNVSFGVVANATPQPAYRWQFSMDGKTWTDVGNASGYNGQNSPNLNIPNVKANMNGTKYRCNIANSLGSIYSNIAALSIVTSPVFSKHPENKKINAGEKTSFSAVANGAPAPTYRWQTASSGSSPWSDIKDNLCYKGANTNTLNIQGFFRDCNGAQYRCVATNSTGTAISNPATLTMTIVAPVITQQPEDRTLLAPAETQLKAIFSLIATGIPAPNYQWQVFNESNKTWATLSNTNLITGVDTNVLTVICTAYRDGNKRYRCMVSNADGQVYSRETLLAMLPFGKVSVSPALKKTHDTDVEYKCDASLFHSRDTVDAEITYRFKRSDGTTTPNMFLKLRRNGSGAYHTMGLISMYKTEEISWRIPRSQVGKTAWIELEVLLPIPYTSRSGFTVTDKK